MPPTLEFTFAMVTNRKCNKYIKNLIVYALITQLSQCNWCTKAKSENIKIVHINFTDKFTGKSVLSKCSKFDLAFKPLSSTLID